MYEELEDVFRKYLTSIHVPEDAFIYGDYWCENLNDYVKNYNIRKYTTEEKEIYFILADLLHRFENKELYKLV